MNQVLSRLHHKCFFFDHGFYSIIGLIQRRLVHAKLVLLLCCIIHGNIENKPYLWICCTCSRCILQKNIIYFKNVSIIIETKGLGKVKEHKIEFPCKVPLLYGYAPCQYGL